MRIFLRIAFAFLIASPLLGPSAIAAPSVAQILDAYKSARGGDAQEGKAALKTDYDMIGFGLTGTVRETIDLATGRKIGRYTLGPTAGAEGFDGSHPWRKDMSGAIIQQTGGDARARAISQAYRDANAWWRPDRGGATITAASKTEAGRPFHILSVTPPGGSPFDAWFDARTNLLARIVERQGAQVFVITFSAWREIEGVLMPGRLVTDNGAGEKYRQSLTLVEAHFVPPPPDDAFAPPKTEFDDFSIADKSGRTTLPIRLINNHIYGEVKINGKGPFEFIFDTGGHNVLTPPLARKLGLAMQGALPGTGTGEGVMEAGFTHVRRIEIGAAAVTDQTFVTLSLQKLREIEGVPLPGMIGFGTFSRFVIQIDYGKRTMTLIDPKRFDPVGAGTAIAFTFNEHIPEIVGRFEGLPATFDIDTGSRNALTLTKPFVEKHGLRRSHPKGVEAVDGWGVGGPSFGYVTRASKIALGPIELDDVVTSFSSQDKGAFATDAFSGNIGGDLLKRFVVTFDYANRVMYLKKLPGPVADSGGYDRAGMWFNDARDGYVIVDVTKGSPADLAGLKMGDVILAVNGKPAKTMTLSDLRRDLRNLPQGTHIDLRIKSRGRARRVGLTLRDLI